MTTHKQAFDYFGDTMGFIKKSIKQTFREYKDTEEKEEVCDMCDGTGYVDHYEGQDGDGFPIVGEKKCLCKLEVELFEDNQDR